jgi:hypothetical protein
LHRGDISFVEVVALAVEAHAIASRKLIRPQTENGDRSSPAARPDRLLNLGYAHDITPKERFRARPRLTL